MVIVWSCWNLEKPKVEIIADRDAAERRFLALIEKGVDSIGSEPIANPSDGW